MKRRAFVAAGACLALSACASKFKTYDGPEVTRIVVMKERRQMYLLHHDQVLKSYRIGLGYAPGGHKLHEGDGRTPEGRYYIDRRNPNSAFHLSIGISYPNQRDVEVARGLGLDPGGDIFIHGRARKNRGKGPDWTAGCISVRDRDIEDIYAMVRDGTVIDILP
ncbi:L,D-transpeptidase family protein [Rhodovulum euryhalinum]